MGDHEPRLPHDNRPARSATPELATDPRTRAYEGGDGSDAVLLVHGFTSTPQSMRDWAEHLQAQGYTVSVPLLPGHATTWQQLNATPWTAWYDEVQRAFTRLTARHDRVFLAGLSMGGGLVLRLAEQHPTRVAGAVLVNPCVNSTDPRIKILSVLRLLGSLGALSGDIARPGAVELAYDRTPLHALYSQTKMWADVRSRLDDVRCPLLIFRSAADHIVDPSSVDIITTGVASSDVTVSVLTRSYHVATLDHEAELIFDRSVEFFRRQAGVGGR